MKHCHGRDHYYYMKHYHYMKHKFGPIKHSCGLRAPKSDPMVRGISTKRLIVKYFNY